MRTLVIAMDAADSRLVERWAAEGRLPAIAALAERGAFVRLSSETGLGPETVWPTFVTGRMPPRHGIYNYRQVDPATHERVLTGDRAAEPAFWSDLAREGAGVPMIHLDLRFAPLAEGGRATQVLGWGERGATRHVSRPARLLPELRRRFGPYPQDAVDREPGDRRLLALRQLRMLRRLTRKRTEILTGLLREHDWELCLGAYYEPHSAGHLFHRHLVPGSWGYRSEAGRLGAALLDVYREFDRGVAELIEAAGTETNVLVFSGLGLRPNTNGVRALDGIMERLGYTARRSESAGTRRVERLRALARAAIPWSLRWKLKRRMLSESFERHLEREWLESTDWERTRAFAESEPGHSFVRVNRSLVGEPAELTEEIATELMRLVNADTGEPAIERVIRLEELGPGEREAELPDLAIVWSRSSLIRRLHHPRAGTVTEELGKLQRTEHEEKGFVVAAGPSIASASEPLSGHLVDLAPTILRCLGAEIPDDLDGTAIDGLLAEASNRAPSAAGRR